jgi:hypothetical protein
VEKSRQGQLSYFWENPQTKPDHYYRSKGNDRNSLRYYHQGVKNSFNYFPSIHGKEIKAEKIIAVKRPSNAAISVYLLWLINKSELLIKAIVMEEGRGRIYSGTLLNLPAASQTINRITIPIFISPKQISHPCIYIGWLEIPQQNYFPTLALPRSG